jgi:hypothetical protein
MPAGLAFNRSYTENSRRRVESDTGAFVISKGWVSFYEFAVSSVTGLVAAMRSFSTEAWRPGFMSEFG